MALPRICLLVAVASVVIGAAPTPGPTVQKLTIGTFVRAGFIAPDGHAVQVQTAVFPRDLVTVRIVDYPYGGPIGETVLRSVQHDVLAAINGGYFTADYRPDGLLEVDGVVRTPVRAGLSGFVGSASDDAPVVALADGVDTAKLRDALQGGPFLVDPGGAHGIKRDDGQRARRSLVILTADKIAIAMTAKCGLYDLATALLQSPEIFGVDHVERALNLDGGPSTGFAVRLPGGEVDVVPETGRLRTVLTIQRRSAPSRARKLFSRQSHAVPSANSTMTQSKATRGPSPALRASK